MTTVPAPPPSSSTLRRGRALSIAALSGFCGLGSEGIHIKILDAVVGSTPLVAFTVVSGFILGMGVGSVLAARARRPWLVELTLAIVHLMWALALPALLGHGGGVIRRLVPFLGLDLAAAVVGLVLTIPAAVLLGITLPVVMELAGDGAVPYALHAGAAAGGILLIELFVHPWLGLAQALILLAGLHGVCALLLRGASPTLRRLPLGRPAPILAAIGVVTGAVQGTWLFLAELLFQPLIFVQAVVVGCFLTGIGVGSYLWSRLRPDLSQVLTAIVVGTTASTALAVVWLDVDPATSWSAISSQIALLTLPVAVPIGAILPAWLARWGPRRNVAGAALLSLAVGNVGGLGIAGLALTRWWMPTTVLAVLATALTLGLMTSTRTPRLLPMLGAVMAVATASTVDTTDVVDRIHPGHPVREVLIEIRGPAELTAVYRFGERRRLYQNGYSPIDLDRGLESAIAAVGLAYAPRFDRALVVGAGSGRSAGAVARVARVVDVVDIGSTIPELLRRIPEDNFHLMDNPSASVHRMDGVQAPLLLEPGYDLVVLTVDPAFLHLASKIYYLESLQRFSRILRDDGVLILWGDHHLGRVGAQILANTGAAVFRHQRLVSFQVAHDGLGYFFLIHGHRPLVWRPHRPPLTDLEASDPVVAQALWGTDDEHRSTPRLHPTSTVHSLWHPALTRAVSR